MSCSRRWSVESKDFELVVAGGETGVRFREKCKGRIRSIFLERDEIGWLVRIFEELVTVEDSRVFWNQASYGLPRVIAQRCFNRHGSFLLVEEYAGSRKSGVVLIPEGRGGEGWDLFGSALHCANEFLRYGGSRVDVRPEVQFQAMRGRRSFAEVLKNTGPHVETDTGVCSGKIAPLPCRLENIPVGESKTTVVPQILVHDPASGKAILKRTMHGPSVLENPDVQRTIHRSKVTTGLNSDAHYLVKQTGTASDTEAPATRKIHSGVSPELDKIRTTLQRLQQEIGLCLADLAKIEGGVVDSGPKASGFRPNVRKAMGFRGTWPKN